MKQNLVSLEFSAAQLEAVDAALAALEKNLAELVTLTAEQRRKALKMGDGSEVFCRQTELVLRQNAGMVPADFELAEFQQDIATLDRSAVNFLDVRTAEEFANGTLEGAYNIPLDELRTRYTEIDRSKPVYLFCQIGLRGYIASRILSSKGYDVYNLAGGYRFASMARTATPPTPPSPTRSGTSASAAAKRSWSTCRPARWAT